MIAIDEERLETDLEYRFRFLSDFIGFGSEDMDVIQSVAPYLGPLIPEIVEATYERLLSFDATARHFVPRQHGYDGPTPRKLSELSLQHEQIRFRKDHLVRYFMQVFGHSHNAKLALYLDVIGKMHTPKAGNAKIEVPLVQMNALMGLLSDILLRTIATFPLNSEEITRTQRAYQKLLWVQSDFIAHHYQATPPTSHAVDDQRGQN